MTDRREAGQDAETGNHAPEPSCTEPKVVPFPHRARRRRGPAEARDPDGVDPGPSAA
jgi:hypothetical protein